MSGGYYQYTDEMYQNFGYLASWAPNTILRLGDVGILRDRIFELETTLSELNIPFTVRTDATPADYEYISSNAVSIKFKAAGEVPSIGSSLSQADAGISINFDDADAIVFQALHCEITSILGLDNLGREIISRYENGDWSKNRVIVTDLITSKSATILISSGHDGQIELAANSNIGLNQFKIANAGVNFRVVNSSKIGTRIIAAENLTPLFKASGIKKQLLRKPTFVRRSESQDVQPSSLNESTKPVSSLSEVTYDDVY